MISTLNFYEIDVAFEDVTMSEVVASFEKHNLTIETYMHFGPAGGNPQFVVSGQDANMTAWADENQGDFTAEDYRTSGQSLANRNAHPLHVNQHNRFLILGTED